MSATALRQAEGLNCTYSLVQPAPINANSLDDRMSRTPIKDTTVLQTNATYIMEARAKGRADERHIFLSKCGQWSSKGHMKEQRHLS